MMIGDVGLGLALHVPVPHLISKLKTTSHI